ncbi:hypothetical protein HRbin21_01438 [bacterium HR21]|nr:hypothetical protein HRbin21_01438 [bacterium HR21]
MRPSRPTPQIPHHVVDYPRPLRHIRHHHRLRLQPRQIVLHLLHHDPPHQHIRLHPRHLVALNHYPDTVVRPKSPNHYPRRRLTATRCPLAYVVYPVPPHDRPLLIPQHNPRTPHVRDDVALKPVPNIVIPPHLPRSGLLQRT